MLAYDPSASTWVTLGDAQGEVLIRHIFTLTAVPHHTIADEAMALLEEPGPIFDAVARIGVAEGAQLKRILVEALRWTAQHNWNEDVRRRAQRVLEQVGE